jgi:hypothetical protein
VNLRWAAVTLLGTANMCIHSVMDYNSEISVVKNDNYTVSYHQDKFIFIVAVVMNLGNLSAIPNFQTYRAASYTYILRHVNPLLGNDRKEKLDIGRY